MFSINARIQIISRMDNTSTVKYLGYYMHVVNTSAAWFSLRCIASLLALLTTCLRGFCTNEDKILDI